MGYGGKDEENPVSEDETVTEAEKRRLRDPKEVEDGMEMQKIPIKSRDAAYPEVIAGHDEPLIKSVHLKYLLLGFNLFLTVLGIALLALSVWIRVDSEFWEYETTLEVDNFKTVSIMFIVGSIIVLVIGCVGSFAAATERRWLLIGYIVIFALVFLLQLAAVVLMWSAPYSTSIAKELEKQIQNQIDQRKKDESSRYFVDFIQDHLQCCGASSFMDYKQEATPPSCQDPTTGNVYDAGCAARMLTYLKTKAGIIGGFALPLLLIQLLALLAAGCLIKSLEVESRYFM